MNGLVTSVVYRNPEFRQQWLFKAIGMGAEGKTANDLVDECQVCGPVMTSALELQKERTIFRLLQLCTYLQELTSCLIQGILAAMNGDTPPLGSRSNSLSSTPAPSSSSDNSCCAIC